MRIKKGFTLAEVLIVLMVIGVIATMTVPSLMKGVADAQFKTAYKKAYNAIVNICAMEKISGALPAKADDAQITQFFGKIIDNLSVKAFAKDSLESGVVIGQGGYSAGLKITYKVGEEDTSKVFGDSLEASSNSVTIGQSDTNLPWVVSEDNIAYAILKGGATSGCSPKATINTQTTIETAVSKSCAIVVVDVNGLSKTPNNLQKQDVSESDAIAQMEGDRFYIYIGKDGATAGSQKTTVTGRITADLS